MDFLDDLNGDKDKRYAPERIQGSERERERDLRFLEKYDLDASNADAPPRIQEKIAKEPNKPMGGEVEMVDMYKPKRMEGEEIEGDEIQGDDPSSLLIGGRKTSGRKTRRCQKSGRKTRRGKTRRGKTRRCQKSGRKTRRGKNCLSLLKKRI